MADKMQIKLFKPHELANLLGVTTQTLQEWDRAGRIRTVRTEGGHRRYAYEVPEISQTDSSTKKCFLYARVSSSKQKPDLERQIAALQKAHPGHDVIKDIGSGINFRRPGLITLLDQVIGGQVSKVVVAHRDRLTRFGFELFQHIFKRFGTDLEVLSGDEVKEPVSELATDLLSIVTVFTARYYGARKYRVHKKGQVLPKPRASVLAKQVPRRIKVLL